MNRPQRGTTSDDESLLDASLIHTEASPTSFVVKGSIAPKIVSPSKTDEVNNPTAPDGTNENKANVSVDKSKPNDQDDETKGDTKKSGHQVDEPSIGDGEKRRDNSANDQGGDNLFANIKMSKKEVQENIAKKLKLEKEKKTKHSKGKPYLQVMEMLVPDKHNPAKCGVVFRLMDKNDNQYWCFKASVVIEVLQLMGEHIDDHYTNYFRDLKFVGLRTLPHGPNEKLKITARGTQHVIPIYAVAVFLDRDPFDKTFETACTKFMSRVSNAMRSNSFRNIFLTVCEENMSDRFNETINQKNQLFFAHAKLAEIKKLPQTSLDAMLLDEDIAGWMTTCFPRFNTVTSPPDLIGLGWRDKKIPTEILAMMEISNENNN
jgi:hypothetical protein